MGRMISLNTSRMQCIGAWHAQPPQPAQGGIVVVHEIYGMNAWVRSVVERLAQAGYAAIAPVFFDHVERDVALGYDEEATRRGRQLVGEVGFELAVEDVASAAEAIASAGRIGCVGYSWGGTIALLAATRLGMPAVSYYGSRNVQVMDEVAQAPLLFHFGARDSSIPPEAIQRHREAWPQAEIHVYPGAKHAFDRDGSEEYFHADSSRLARERTAAFFARHLRGVA
ncbi:MAG: dienelactone hydrolase family protein [Xanthomonadales bacterium]|nr:MAG: dienelactone hydrolase family protein [Dokdonella sp.]MBC6941952.1 dienelactone hydrolase family protein [Xanthomonadales bacterium]MCC6596779.1 dienelactone hydrolase family protein [Rhodanobacteraceae bacterium]MDL1868468.1 dienelactone hydrolase family protein [Gammaproteobacteria bacterium PRO6]